MRLGLGISIPGTSGLVQAAFSPLDLSPVLWLDASDTSTITEVAGAVSQWDNKGSLGDFTQATAALQPTTGVTTQNGLNVIDFAADYLRSADAASAWNDLHNGTSWIAAFVAIGTFAADSSCGLLGTTLATAQIGASVLLDDRPAAGDQVFSTFVSKGSAGNYVIRNLGDSLSFPRNSWNLGSLINDPDNGTAADRSRLFLDDGAAQANNTLTNAPVTTNATNTLDIGSYGNGQGLLTGSIAELIIVTGSNATESNRQALRDYLNNKWAVY